MITVHHLNNSRSQRVLWLLEELGVEYQVQRYERDPKTMLAPPSLKAVHPLGKSPVVTDGDRTLAESGAILEYLVERHGGGRLIPPAGSDDRLRYTYWMHFAEGSAMSPLLLKLIFERIPPNLPFLVRPIGRMISAGVTQRLVDPQLKDHLDFMEAELGRRGPYFAGPEFTAADVQMSFPLEAAAARAGLDATRPRLWDLLQRLHARPAYQAALKVGGPYELLK